ncbi:MAG: nuclear transport factor 2 family protein [Thermomicrobiales bacterium]
MAKETIQAALDAYFAAIKALDTEAFVACFAADAVQEDPVGTPPNQGHDAIRRFFNGITGGFDQLELTPDSTFINGNSAAVKWTGHGVAKNGREGHFEGIDVVDVNDAGSITRLRAFWNPAALMAQVR